uniref:Uncharacterized protein n=1 Tax=Panagrolaimus sp. PS1159 TaxID=55785 RepID=A0AC35F8F5_9BILA
MEMKWLYGIFVAFITFTTVTNAAKNNIPRLYNSNRYRTPSISTSSNYNNNYSRDDGGYYGSDGPQQWRRLPQQPWQQQQQFPWKNQHYFFREVKNNRTCGRVLSQRVSNVCGGCPPDGLTSIRKRAGGKRSGAADPKIVEACCIAQCPDDVIKTLACNECNI